MKVVSPLFGFLGKANAGHSATPEEGDTKVIVPGIVQPTLEIPFPVFSFVDAPLPAGGNVPVNSIIFSQKVVFNAALGEVLFIFGPGLWRNNILMYLEEAGAVSDATSTCSLTILDSLTAKTIELMRVTNKQGLDQSKNLSFDLLVTSDQQYNVARQRVAGLGTGLNLCCIVWSASRLF